MMIIFLFYKLWIFFSMRHFYLINLSLRTVKWNSRSFRCLLLFACVSSFSMMFKPAKGEKFSLAAISDSIQDLVKFFQVILFFILKNIYFIFFGKLFLTDTMDLCYLDDRHLRDTTSREL